MWSDSQLLAMHKAPETAGVYAHFFIKAEEDLAATKREGRPIFHDVEYVELLIPANPKTKPVYRVKPEHREKWSAEYAKFKAKQEQRPEGMPLEEWSYLTRSRVAELRAMNVFTVEQVASLSDGDLQKIGPDGLELRKRARQHLQPEDATIKQLRAEIAEKDARLSMLEAAVAQLQGIKAKKKADE